MIDINHHDELKKILLEIPTEFQTKKIFVTIIDGYVAKQVKHQTREEFGKIMLADMVLSYISRWSKASNNPKEKVLIALEHLMSNEGANKIDKSANEDRNKKIATEQVLDESSNKKPLKFAKRMDKEDVRALIGNQSKIFEYAKSYGFKERSFYNAFLKAHSKPKKKQ